MEKLKDSTQAQSIGSVLVASVAFGATFALPGGYRADDHPNGGTPTLGGRYTFDAFMVAIALAFIYSSIATIGFIYSGSSTVNLRTRQIYLIPSIYLMHTSVTALVAAFALGMYTVLAPVSPATAIAVCVISLLVSLWCNLEKWWRMAFMFRAIHYRNGRRHAFVRTTAQMTGYLLTEYWPLVFIFCWPLFSKRYRVA